MEADQTGFTSSPPTPNATTSISTPTNGNNNNATANGTALLNHTGGKGHQRNDSPSHHSTSVLLKDKSKDELEVEEDEQQLPSISEVESWRTAAAAYYTHPLVAVIDDSSAIYDYKLPSLAKFGKGLTTAFGKLPAAIWSVAVTSPEESPSIPAAATVVTSPSAAESRQQQQQQAATIYLQRALEKERSVIIQQVMPDGSVQLRPLHAHQPGEEGAAEVKSSDVPVEDLPPLAPAAAVEVKREGDAQAANHDNGRPPEAQEMAPMQQQHDDEGLMTFEEPNLGTGQYSVLTNVVVTSPPEYAAAAQNASGGLYTLTAATSDYYREYYAHPTSEQYTQIVRQQLAAVVANNSPSPTANAFATANGGENSTAYVEQRYVRAGQPQAFSSDKGAALSTNSAAGNLVELPSPESEMGEAVNRRDLHQIFEYADIAQHPSLLQAEQDPTGVAPPPSCSSASTSPTPLIPGTSATGARKGSWSGSGGSSSEYGRTPEADKVHIPKVFSDVGFRYYLESPISTSQRRDDDRMTYINKGQYYGLTLEYIPDPDRPLRSCTVKSLVMLVFREEKSAEDELKAWKFWHSRQHSVKQRILDVDTKNSSGVIGQIEEVTHNAIAFYWNPLDGPAKVSVSVHCLSTDFSNQKGVKGLPLHLQIDTTDDLRENGVRIHRGYCQIKVFCDKGAERKTRDEERRAAKRKLTATPNSRKKLDEMYHLPCERSEFYSMSDLIKPPVLFMPQDDPENCNGPELTFYAITTVPMENSNMGEDVKSPVEVITPTPAKKLKFAPSDRVLLYAKRADEEIFHPLHLVPPTLAGLSKALEAKYGISSDMIRHLYKRCKKGITVEMDDDIIRHYCNEDTFLIDLIKTEDGHLDVTLVEL